MSEDNRTVEQLDTAISNLESTIGGSKDKPEDRPTLFEKASDAKLTENLGAIYDKAEAKADAADEAKTVPTVVKNIDDAFEATWNHINSSPAEKAELRNANKLVETARQQAAKFGVTLTDAEAFKAALDLENAQRAEEAAGHAPVVDHMRSVYPDQNPVESAKFFADIKRSADQDLPGTVAWMAQQYGMHPMQVAQAIAQRYGNAPVPQQSFEQSQQRTVAAVQSMLDQAAETLPDLAQFEDEMIEIINSKSFKRTGNYQKDFLSAYNTAKKRDGKLTADQKLEKSLRRTYDRANSRKG
jgi:hypothetical protein